MSIEINDIIKKDASVDLKKREFMGKVGKYAVVGAGMATLMTPTKSSACNYGGGGCGCGSRGTGKDWGWWWK